MTKGGSIACLFLSVTLLGCSASEDISRAREKVSAFHSTLDAGKFDEIYLASSPVLKAKNSKEDFTKLLEAVHRKLGASKSSKEKTWNVSVRTSGTVVSLVYFTVFSEGDATEKFVYGVADDGVRLVSYDISSNALIVK